jgi:hypothetical protein
VAAVPGDLIGVTGDNDSIAAQKPLLHSSLVKRWRRGSAPFLNCPRFFIAQPLEEPVHPLPAAVAFFLDLALWMPAPTTRNYFRTPQWRINATAGHSDRISVMLAVCAFCFYHTEVDNGDRETVCENWGSYPQLDLPFGGCGLLSVELIGNGCNFAVPVRSA